MRRTRAPTTTRIILILLAISDSAPLVVNMIYTYKIDLELFGKPFFDLSDGICKMYVWAHIFFGSITGWLVVILTIERGFAVLMPLTVKRIVSKGRLKVFLVVFVSFFLGRDVFFGYLANQKFYITRMHSSRMRTGRSLTVRCSLLPEVGGVPGQGGVCSRGVSALGGLLPGGPGPGGWVGGGVCSWGVCSGGSASRGVCSQGGVPGPGGSASWGVCLVRGVCLLGGAWSRGSASGRVYSQGGGFPSMH